MRRFTHSQTWTVLDYIKLNNTMAIAAENAAKQNGFVLTYKGHLYQSGKSSDVYWNSMIMDGLRRVSQVQNRTKDQKVEEYSEMQKKLWNYLGNRDDLWMTTIDQENIRERKEEIEDLCQRMDILAYHHIPDESDGAKVRALKQSVADSKINFHDVIEFANIMDLNNATAKMIENKDAVREKISAAMALIERSYGQSSQNSNISGLLYTELRNLSQELQDLPERDIFDDSYVCSNKELQARCKVAASLDKLDLLATKYLDYKVGNYRETAYDKIKAAALVKNIVKFCYSENGYQNEILSVDEMNIKEYMDQQEIEKRSRKFGAEIDRQNMKGTKIVKNEFEKMEDDIMNLSIKKMSDHTLENAIRAKQQEEPVAGPQL